MRQKRLLVGVATLVLFSGCSRQQARITQQRTEKAEPVKPPVAYFHPDPKTAGVLSGKILFHGKRPVRQKIDMDEDPQCSEMHKGGLYSQALVVNRNATLANVFVYIKSGLQGKTFETPSNPVTIDQKGCWFEPRVLGIQTGQILKVTNSDPVTHNIHPLAQINRAWNQSQDQGAMPLARRFMKPEVMIRVKCNIHSWMRAWIGVLDHPYFAVTETEGTFKIGDVPPGTYTIAAWQEELGEQTQEVTVGPSAHKIVDFTFKGE